MLLRSEKNFSPSIFILKANIFIFVLLNVFSLRSKKKQQTIKKIAFSVPPRRSGVAAIKSQQPEKEPKRVLTILI